MAHNSSTNVNNPCNLIINYIPPHMTEHDLKTLFCKVGEVKKTKIVRDRATGISLGFGFVEYMDEGSAARAVETLDGLSVQTKRLKVAYARSQEDVGANIHVRNLDQTVSAKDVEQYFGGFGEIIRARVLNDPQSGISRGIAFVLFANRDEAETAVNTLNGRSVPGFATSPMCVRFALDHKKKCQAEAARGLPGIQFPATAPPHPLLAAQAATGIVGLGTGYGGSLGGGPVRSSFPRQRFNPLAGLMTQLPDTSAIPGLKYESSAPNPNLNVKPALPAPTGYVLFVYNLGPDADERDLWQLFGPFGAVQKVDIISGADNKPKGYGFVTMTKAEDAANAISYLNGFLYKERVLQVSLKTQKH